MPPLPVITASKSRQLAAVALAAVLTTASVAPVYSAGEEGDPFVSILNQGRVDEARAWLTPKLEASPNDPLLRLYHSMILAIRAPEEAVTYLRQLVNEQPSFAEAHNNLAVILAQQGEYADALTHAERALAIRADYPEALENLAHLHAWVSASTFDRAIKLSPDNNGLKRKLSILIKLFEPPEGGGTSSPATAAPTIDPLAGDKGLDPIREREVVDALGEWVEAWSHQQVERYLASYSLAFVPSDGKSRQQWEAERRERIDGKRKIRVTLEEIDVISLDGDRAETRFVQKYRSPTYRDTVTKRIALRNEGDAWRIVREEVEQQGR